MIFGENVSTIWRDRSAITLEVWRNLFGEIVVGDLEKLFGDFVLELVIEYRNDRRPYVEIEK